MISRIWHRIFRFLASPRLATWLLVAIGVWSMMATLVPQTLDNGQKVAAWAAAHPILEPVARVLGLHHAFTSVVFRLFVFALGLSTALCAWRRTKAAIGRMRALGKAAGATEESLVTDHDLEITYAPALGESEILSRTTRTLEWLGIRPKRRGRLLSAVSPRWSVFGSPVFHWGLVALVLVVLAASLQRSEGLMGVAVGQTKADVPESYGVLRAGMLHNWSKTPWSIRVDAFETHFRTGKIDHGPTPTVSVLDASGRVVKTQRVYPNNPLQTGPLTVHRSDDGLTVTLVLLNGAGVETGRSVQLVDFSAEASSGTVPLDSLNVSDNAGNALLTMSVTVPLDRKGGRFVKEMPQDPAARLVVVSPDGKTVLDRVIAPGEQVALPTGDTLRLDGIGWYARLKVVDDRTTPFLYLALAVALVGLTLTVAVRQQAVLGTVVEDRDGFKLVASIRLWRNVSTNREEIENELAKALGDSEKEKMT